MFVIPEFAVQPRRVVAQVDVIVKRLARALGHAVGAVDQEGPGIVEVAEEDALQSSTGLVGLVADRLSGAGEAEMVRQELVEYRLHLDAAGDVAVEPLVDLGQPPERDLVQRPEAHEAVEGRVPVVAGRALHQPCPGMRAEAAVPRHPGHVGDAVEELAGGVLRLEEDGL